MQFINKNYLSKREKCFKCNIIKGWGLFLYKTLYTELINHLLENVHRLPFRFKINTDPKIGYEKYFENMSVILKLPLLNVYVEASSRRREDLIWSFLSTINPISPPTYYNSMGEGDKSCNTDAQNRQPNNHWGYSLHPESLPLLSEASECLAKFPCCWTAEISMYKCAHQSDRAKTPAPLTSPLGT